MAPSSPKPLVGIVMGSTSDLEAMREAATVLDGFDVAYEMKIVSAHRSPALCDEYALSAEKRGLKVVIAGAGGSAALAGVIAARTTLPVIGVPMETKALGGLDSLLSTVQMPGGVPVATVGIGNAKNAALLAVRMLALLDSSLGKKLADYRGEMEQKIKQAGA